MIPFKLLPFRPWEAASCTCGRVQRVRKLEPESKVAHPVILGGSTLRSSGVVISKRAVIKFKVQRHGHAAGYRHLHDHDDDDRGEDSSTGLSDDDHPRDSGHHNMPACQSHELARGSESREVVEEDETRIGMPHLRTSRTREHWHGRSSGEAHARWLLIATCTNASTEMLSPSPVACFRPRVPMTHDVRARHHTASAASRHL